MKYKVGDIVITKPWEEWDEVQRSNHPGMARFCGMIASITKVLHWGVYTLGITGDQWAWTDRELKPLGGSGICSLVAGSCTLPDDMYYSLFEGYNKIQPMPYSAADSILTPRHFINLIGEHEFLTLNIKA